MSTIELTKVSNGAKPGWHMSYNNHDYGPGDYPTMSVPAQQTGSFAFSINGSPGVTFSSDPLWIAAGSAKPASSGVDAQFSPVTGAGTTKLSFGDTNQTKGDYAYSLHFSDGSTLDPIISNGGCCPGNLGWSSSSILLLGVAVVAVLLLAYFGYRQFVKRPATGVEPGSDIGE